ncbi:gamma-glutamylcyclotransferase family protein [Aminipila luticellarii]|uniref:Gamma-glutamylcyclotransferase n=1 Tax=Aminipila luticellarii TaxID=2507160 RepID=A0A410PYA9_9FIRM|nr:gamma-glutamylcyclotransferase family protein [Aminipila luticellarii]QAT43836.1 gamma-glutamylcyclotransferase [Aminipila luticellarii]
MKKSYKLYAAYGSNMSLKQMARRCPGAKIFGVGVIENYKLTFRGSRRGLANIEKNEGASIPVVLWKITAICEKALDFYEGFPKLYVKKQIPVRFEEEEIEAMTYVMSDRYCNFPVKPSPYYIEMLQQGYESHGIIKDGIFDAVQDIYRELAMKKIYQR